MTIYISYPRPRLCAHNPFITSEWRAALQRPAAGVTAGEGRVAPPFGSSGRGKRAGATVNAGSAIAPTDKVPAPRDGFRLTKNTYEAKAVSGSVCYTTTALQAGLRHVH